MEPYKQSLSHSCLVAALLMLARTKYRIKFSEKDEAEILLKGMDRKYPFYIVGVPKEVYNKYRKKLNIVVDNKYFTKVLVNSFADEKNFSIQHKKITVPLIRELLEEKPLVCHIDDHYLGDYSHDSHFIVLEKATEKGIRIIDPINGEKRLISDKKLEDAIQSLKKHIRMCPIIYYL